MFYYLWHFAKRLLSQDSRKNIVIGSQETIVISIHVSDTRNICASHLAQHWQLQGEGHPNFFHFMYFLEKKFVL